MKTVIGAAVIVAALVPWQPIAQATTMVATDVEGQPLTRAACDKAGLAWNDSRNICDFAESHSSLTSEIASEPQRATKQSTRVNSHTKRKYTHTRQTQVVKSRPFPLFRLFRD